MVDSVFKAFVSNITSLGYVGNKPCWQSVVDKTLSSHSHVSKAFSKRNTSYWTVQVLTLTDFGCRCLTQLWRVTDPRPDLENLCGHDTGGILGADRWSLDNHSTVRNSLYGAWHPGMGAGLLAFKNGFILFIKNYQFSLQINTRERERDQPRYKQTKKPVYVSRVKSLVLVCSLSSHRHSYTPYL